MYHTCAITTSGDLYCWGNSGKGRIGNGHGATAGNQSAPYFLSAGVTVTSVSGGFSHTCMVLNGGARCWGYNLHGRLGTGSYTQLSTPPASDISFTPPTASSSPMTRTSESPSITPTVSQSCSPTISQSATPTLSDSGILHLLLPPSLKHQVCP
jgi:alpha-tubulin suppressor-like RCC1 family protein